MKKLILSAVFLVGVVFSVSGQVMPPGSSDKNLDDRNIKDRSIELEKAKRDAEKSDTTEQVEKLRFTQIKEDFEKFKIFKTASSRLTQKASRLITRKFPSTRTK